MYRCSTCVFDTQYKYNLSRHFQTSVHKRNEAILSSITDRQDSAIDLNDRGPVSDQVNTVNGHASSLAEVLGEDLTHDDDVNLEETYPDVPIECNDWFPFKSKLHYYLKIFHRGNLKHPASRSQVNFVRQMLKAVGIKDVPSQEDIERPTLPSLTKKLVAEATSKANGIPFYFISPNELAKLLIANPKTASKLSRYPIKNQKKNEQCSSLKWTEELPTPYSTGYYSGDIVKIGTRPHLYGKIKRFFIQEEENSQTMMATCQIMLSGEHYIFRGHQQIEKDEIILMEEEIDRDIVVSQLGEKCVSPKVQHAASEDCIVIRQLSDEEKREVLEVHPISPSAREVVPVYLNIFADDASGNRSKVWNAYHVLSTQLAGLPNREKQQMRNISFISCSNLVPITDIMNAVLDDIENGDVLRDVSVDGNTGNKVHVQTFLDVIQADNDMAALLSNCMGGSAKKPCHKCQTTRNTAECIVNPRTMESTKEAVNIIKAARTETEKKLRRKESGVRETPDPNPTWDRLCFQTHRDLAGDLLHDLKAGAAKAVVSKMLSILSEQNKELFMSYCSVIDWRCYDWQITQGFVDHPANRPFKEYFQLSQVLPHLFVLLGQEKEDIEICIKLAEIMHAYFKRGERIFPPEVLQTLDGKYREFLQCLFQRYPEEKAKTKLHVNLHLPECIRYHGDPRALSNEKFEEAIGLTRNAQVYSNRQAPSRDSANAFAENIISNHVLSGGYWIEGERVYSCGKSVVDEMEEDHIQKFIFGKNEAVAPGTLTKSVWASGKRTVENIDLTEQAALKHALGDDFDLTSAVHFQNVQSLNKEHISQGQDFVYEQNGDMKMATMKSGYKIGGMNYVTAYSIDPVISRRTGEPKLSKRLMCQIVQKSNRIVVISAIDVIHSLALVHYCKKANCRLVFKRVSFLQERKKITKFQSVYACDNSCKLFLVNRFCYRHPVALFD